DEIHRRDPSVVRDLAEEVLLDEVPPPLLERAEAVAHVQLVGDLLRLRFDELERVAVAEPRAEPRCGVGGRRVLAQPSGAHFADHDILTPGDRPNVLVAMNPAALKTNIADLPPGGTLIVNSDAFAERNLQKAGYDANPLTDGSLADYNVHEVPLTSMTVEALKKIEITSREAERAKNMFALGLMS